MLFKNGTINKPRMPVWLNLFISPIPHDKREIAVSTAILIGVGVASATGLVAASMSASAQKEASEENIAYARESEEKNLAYAREEQARLATAKEQERQRQEEERRREEERLAPWYEAQKSAIQRYTEMAENPEISDLTRIRLEEEEKAINKELAAKGLLFSGPAAELRQKSRERIIAQETESAKQMLQYVMGVQAPTSGILPGTSQYDALIASLTPKAMAPGVTVPTGAGQGVLGVGAAALGGAQSYLTYQGSKDIANALAQQKTTGLYSYPLSLYGKEGYGVGGEMGVGLY